MLQEITGGGKRARNLGTWTWFRITLAREMGASPLTGVAPIKHRRLVEHNQ